MCACLENQCPSGSAICLWACSLRSNWDATHIADPTRSLTLEAFQAASGNHFSKPVPLERFVQYGRWYQRQALPDLDQREIVRVETSSTGFQITLEDGESFSSRRVVVAAGIHPFARRPPNSLIWTLRSPRTRRNIATLAG